MNASHLRPSDFGDSNLLFAVVALQRGFLDQTKFVDACAAWAVRRDTPLPDLLIERRWLNSADKTQIEQDLERLLQKHQGDVRASIQEMADDQVRQSLAHIFNDPSLAQVRPSELVLTEQPASRRTRDRYVLVGEAKKGGIGLVWRARDIELGREVALKELRKDRVLSIELRERFLAEAQVNAQLTHPNIVPAFDLVHSGGGESPFYTMQYVEGRTLTDAARDFHTLRKASKAGMLELRELLAAFVSICKAVDYAHDRGVLHRDLKGLNVILGNHGEVFLLDWGMAKVVGQAEAATQETPVELATMDPDAETRAGALLGTPAYMAPEQAAGDLNQIDRRTDVYGLGVILFEILTGRLPFEVAETPSLFEGLPADVADRMSELNRRRIERLLHQVQHEPAPSPRKLQPFVPAPLDKVCLKAVSKKKADRYSSAKELAREVERWLGDEPVVAWPEPWTAKTARWARQHKPLVAAGAALLVAALPLLTVLFLLSESAREGLELEQGKTQKALALAITNEELADKRRIEADERRKKAESLAVQLKFEQAFQLPEDKRLLSMLSTARLLNEPIVMENQALRESLGLHLGSWIGQAHRLKCILSHQDPVLAVTFSPDGKFVLTASEDKTARLMETATLKLSGPPLQHQERVTAVAFSPDGKSVMTGSDDKTARLWETATGKPLGPPLEHQHAVKAVAFSPDGKIALTGSLDGTARLWLTNTGMPVGPPLQHQLAVYALAFSPDCKTVLTGSDDKTAQMWETSTGKPVGPPLQHQDRIRAVAFSPNGKSVLTGSWDGTARLWESATGKPLGPPLHHKNSVLTLFFGPDGKPVAPPLHYQNLVVAVAFSPDGTTVLTGSHDQTARLWEAATGKPLGPPLQHQDWVVAVAFSPDGKIVLTGSQDKTARLWKTSTGKPLGPPLQHQKGVSRMAVSPDGKNVLTVSHDNTVRLWETATGRSFGPSLQHQERVLAVAFSPDSKTVLTGSQDKTARLWDAATLRPLGLPLQHQNWVVAVAFSPDGKTVLTGSWDKTARLWETATRKPFEPSLQHQGRVRAVAFSPDGKTLLTGSDDKTAQVWESATRKALGPPLQHQRDVTAVAFSSDSKTVLTGSTDNTAQHWQASTGKPLGPSLPHIAPVIAVAFSRDGKTVLTGSWDATARLWEKATGMPLGPPLQHQDLVEAAVFSPDGKFVLTACRDNTARLWDTATLKPVGPPLQHQNWVVAVAFSPNGKIVLTGSFDKTARLWETATGKPLGSALHHQREIRAVGFSPDGKAVVTGSFDNTARLWRVPRSIEGDPERILLAVQVITGLELDDYGGMRVLDTDTWQKRRQRLQELGGPLDVD